MKYILICIVALWATEVFAQFLPTEENNLPLKNNVVPVNSVQNLNVSKDKPTSAARAAIADRESQNKNLSPFDYSKIEVENENKPRQDIVTFTDKNGKKLNDEVILVYMKNFNIHRTASRQIRCSMRFAMISTYKEKISNISCELKWPQISTRLSFSDVRPQVEYYIDYMLLGDGCYTMDKFPNIIVNRCRVKNKAQEACAASVRWINLNM